jgi:replicative DNA helicase
MDVGRNIIATVLRNKSALKKFTDEGFDLDWLNDKEDLSRAAIFGETDIEAYRFILKTWESNRAVPSLDYFRHAFPAQSFRLPESDLSVAELLAMACEDRKRVQLEIAGSAFIDLHDDGQYDEALDLIEAAAKRIRRSRTDGSVHITWDSDDYDLEAKLNRVEVPGIRTGIPELDDKFAGWQPGQLVTYLGRAKAAKALALNTPIPTPSGWTTMGAVQEGDQVFDSSGKVCRVISVTPVMRDHTCYKVRFRSGEAIIADAGHLWVTERLGRTAGDWREGVRTTEDIRATLRMHGRNAHRVRVAGGLDLPEVSLPIDPYILGYWLGDGTSSKPEITCADTDLPFLRAKVTAAGLYILSERRNSLTSARIWISTYPVSKRGRHDTFKGSLRQLGVLRNKHIPAVYLRASYDQRLALLQGLMDSDGTMSKRYDATFTTIYYELARQVHELCESLGVRAKIHTRTVSLNGDDVGLAYLIRLVPDEIPVFSLARKLNKGITRTRGSKYQYRYVESVTPHYSVPVKCIMVNSPDHTYLVGEGFIPTHNTSHAIKSALAAHDDGFNVLLASVEITGDSIADRCDAFAAGVEHDTYIRGRLTDREKTRLRAAKSYRGGDEYFNIVQPVAQYTITDLEADVDRYRPHVVYVDGFYFLTDRNTGKSGGNWEGHDNLARELKELALRRNIVIVVTMQVREKQTHGKGGFDDNTMMGGTGLLMASDMVLTLDMDKEDWTNTIACSRSRTRYLPTIRGQWHWKTSAFQVMRDEWGSEEDDDAV